MATTYQDKVYDLVRQVPAGQVASYGMIASLLAGVTARMVGYALAASASASASGGDDIPWQRIINSQGKLSIPGGMERQRAFLVAEGVEFTKSDRISWRQYGWNGPSQDWLEAHDFEIADFMTIKAGWP